MIFYFVRHGAKEAVRFDPELTEVGKKQAELTGKYLKDIDISKIFASPKKRTAQTAEIINSHIQSEIVFDNRLIERMEWEHESFDDFLMEWDRTDFDRNFVPSHGTSSSNKGKQVRLLLDEVIKGNKDGNFLLVTHGGTIGDMLRNLFTRESVPHITHPVSKASYVDILECSITKIEYENGKFNITCINDTTHLPQPVL